jgi:ubiquinone/menaquinone biosynthesis C-methylase UbiE
VANDPGILGEEAQRHYRDGIELSRLQRGSGSLEFARTRELLTRHLPQPPAVVLDIGGGPGAYACWLAELGYTVHLIDPVPLHVEQASEASRQLARPVASVAVGDARDLPYGDSSADAVLLLGPLYHLVERDDRLKALREAFRVLRPNGQVFAVGISRFASTLDGLKSGYVDDPEFVRIYEQDLLNGQHRNPTNHPHYFTTAFFHHPAELKEELVASGFAHHGTFGIEGPAWMLQDFSERWDSPRRERLLAIARALEQEPTLLGVSAHLLAVGAKRPITS